MQFKTIDGINVPEIGLGTYKLYGKECKSVVEKAIDIGYRHIDTAQMYKNERDVGEAIHKSNIDREEFFVTTKIWHTNLEHDIVLQTVEESLKDLKMPYVDLLLIHWPNEQYSLFQTLEAMLVLRDQGKVKQIGVSNFPLNMVQSVIEDLRIPLFANQVEYHPFLGQFDLLDYSYDHEFLITAYSPLAQGKVQNSDLLIRLGQKYSKSPSQIALRWLIEQENVVAIPKSSSEKHLKENVDIFDFALEDEDFDAIDQLEKNHRLVNPGFAPKWDDNIERD